MNANNMTTLTGTLVADPRFIPHADGSKTVYLKIAVRDNFKSKVVDAAGNVTLDYATQFIDAQGFVPATPKNPAYPNGIYGLCEKGEYLTLVCHMASYVVPGGAVDANGNKVNRWEQCLRIDLVQKQETKTDATLRRANQAKKAAANTAPVATAPVAAAATQPGYASAVGSDYNIPGMDA